MNDRPRELAGDRKGDDALSTRMRTGIESGNLLMYKHPYHMQVTHISFDPYDENRILVGTRDAASSASRCSTA